MMTQQQYDTRYERFKKRCNSSNLFNPRHSSAAIQNAMRSQTPDSEQQRLTSAQQTQQKSLSKMRNSLTNFHPRVKPPLIPSSASTTGGRNAEPTQTPSRQFTIMEQLSTSTQKLGSITQKALRYSPNITSNHFDGLPKVTPSFKHGAQNKMMSKTQVGFATADKTRAKSPFKNSRLQDLTLQSISPGATAAAATGADKSAAKILQQSQEAIDEYGFTVSNFNTTQDQMLHQKFRTTMADSKARTGWHSTENFATTQDISQNVCSRVNSLIKADQDHAKSQKLFLYLKKQAQKQLNKNSSVKDVRYESKSKQRQIMQAAMDQSVKVGPVLIPAKLKKAEALIEKQLKKKKTVKKMKHQEQHHLNTVVSQSTKRDNKDAKQDHEVDQIQNNAEASQCGEAVTSINATASSRSVLQDFKTFNERSKQDYQQTQEKSHFNYSTAIFQMLEKSCNIKMQAKRLESIEEKETEMRLTGFKMKERVNRVIQKIFERDIELNDVFLDRGQNSEEDAEDQRPSKQTILQTSLTYIEDLCSLCKQVTSQDEQMPLLDQVEASDDEMPWRESRQHRALKEINKCIELQKKLLAETGISLEDPPFYDFEPRPFEDEHKTQKQRQLAKVVKEKFGTDGHNKIELKTCQVLFDEVISQVRLWSSKHADLLCALTDKQKTLRIENQQLIQKKAHLVRDKLAKRLIDQTTQLEKTQQRLSEKLHLLDQSLKAQQIMDKNLNKAYELFHGSNQKQKDQEKELANLQQFLMKWMPHFHKYGFHEGFKDGIRFITEDYVIQAEEEAAFWDKQDLAQHFDTEVKMWGLSPRTNPDSVFFNDKSLREKYTKQELWLRSDVYRLTKIFNIATPDRVELEGIRKQFNMLQWKNNQMDDMLLSTQKELRIRWKQIDQLKKLEVELVQEQSRLSSENIRLHSIIDVPKFEKGAQVEIISSQTGGKLSKMDRKILAQQRREQQRRKTSTMNIGKMQKGLTMMVDDLPKLDSLPMFDNKPRLDALETMIAAQQEKAKNPQQAQQVAIMQANQWLGKIHEIDFKQLLCHMDQRIIKKHLQARRRHNYKVELEPRYNQLGQFYSQLILKYPYDQKSAWSTLVDVFEDNANDLMQGLHDLYALGEEDWRFLLVQYVCGIFYNKTDDRKQVNACLVDKYESAYANLASVILINAKIDTDQVFGQQIDPETMIDIDIVVQSLAKGLRHIFKNQRIFMELIFPQVLILAYARLMKDIQIIEAVSYESATLERLIYQLNVEKVSPQALEQVELFNQIVNQINRVGLSELHPDVDKGSDQISTESFLTFVSEKLGIKLPEAFQDPKNFAKFVHHRILNFKSHSLDLNQQMEQVDEEIDAEQGTQSIYLRKEDLESLQHIVIQKKIPLRKALMTAVQAAQNVVRIRQSYFEPIFNRYADRLTVGSLNLEGTFYQSLLFVAKSNISNIFLDNLSQNTATLQINERARMLINNLRKMKKLKQISLPKFTNICLELDLLEYVPATLKRLGKSSMLKLPDAMYACSECLQEINPAFPKSNQIVHSRAYKYMQNNDVNRVLNLSSKQFFMQVRYCAMLLRSKFFSSVFDLHDEDRIAQSFNIFVDSELSEMNQMVIIASMSQKKPKDSTQKQLSESPQRRRRAKITTSPQRMTSYANSNQSSRISPRVNVISKSMTKVGRQLNHGLTVVHESKDTRMRTVSRVQSEQRNQSSLSKSYQSRDSMSLTRMQESPSIDERSATNSDQKEPIRALMTSPSCSTGDARKMQFRGIFPQPTTNTNFGGLSQSTVYESPTNNATHNGNLDEIIESDLVSKSEREINSPEEANRAIKVTNVILSAPSPLQELSERSSSVASSQSEGYEKEVITVPNTIGEGLAKHQENKVTLQIAEEEPILEADESTDIQIKLVASQVTNEENVNGTAREDIKVFYSASHEEGHHRNGSAIKDAGQEKQETKYLSPQKDESIVSQSVEYKQKVRTVRSTNRPKEDTMRSRDVASATLKSQTQHPQSASNFSSTTLQQMQQPVVEVSKVSPSGQITNLLEDNHYHRRQSAQQRTSSAARRREDGRPPTHVIKQDASIEKHRQRISKGHQTSQAVFRCYTQEKCDTPATNDNLVINSDLDELDALLIDGASQRSTVKSVQKKVFHDTKKFKIASLKKPQSQNKQRDVHFRSSTVKDLSSYLGVDHGPPRKGDLFGKGKAYITQVGLAPANHIEQRKNQSSRSRSKKNSQSPPTQQEEQKSREQLMPFSNSQDRLGSSQSRSGHQQLSKQAETKIKLLSAYKKSRLGDASTGQGAYNMQDFNRLMLISENLAMESQASSRIKGGKLPGNQDMN